MKQQQIDTDSVKRSIDMRTFVEPYTALRKQSTTTSAGPCPWCGGTDRFVVFADNFFCNPGPGHCGRKGDIYTFVQDYHNVDFRKAHEMLTGGAMPATSAPAQPVKQAAKSTASEFNEQYWLSMAVDAHNTLLTATGRITQRARDYLTGRGFTRETIEAFKLGFHGINLPGEDGKEAAISIPWFDQASRLVAIKFRFIDEHLRPNSKGEMEPVRYTNRGSLKGHVFGWQTVKGPARNNVFIACEGEFNAMALWQAGKHDILCSGSESGIDKLPQDVIDYAQQYAYRIAWADEKGKANNAARRIKADFSMSSLKADGIKLDANKLLEIDKLEALLTGMLHKIGADIPVKPEPDPVADEEWQRIVAKYGRPAPVDNRPPLPAEMWYAGEQVESWKLFNTLRETYACRWFQDKGKGAWCVTE